MPDFKGVQKCEYCTLEQIIIEQVKLDLSKEKANEENEENKNIRDRGKSNT